MDIENIRRVQKIVGLVQSIIRFIYNHTWAIALMRSYTGREILRPDLTWFAMNYIALDSLFGKKVELRQMFVSPEWQQSRYARTNTEGSTVDNLVTRQTFWQRAEKVVQAIKPLYEVLRAVDSERYSQMGFMYYMMQRTKENIQEADSTHASEYIRIIDNRWSYQMSTDLYLAGTHQIKNDLNF